MGTHVFNTPYDLHDPLNGQECTVVDSPLNKLSNAALSKVRFDSGITLEVWAEEIHEKGAPCPNPSSPTPPPSGSATT